MVECVRGWIEDFCQKPPPVESKLDVKAAVRKFGTPIEDEVTMRRCHKCGDVFNPEKLTMLPIAGGKLKPFCGECVDNIKNGQG